MDDSRIRDWAGGSNDTADYGDVFCGGTVARTRAGAAGVFWACVLDRIYVAGNCGGSLDWVDAKAGGERGLGRGEIGEGWSAVRRRNEDFGRAQHAARLQRQRASIAIHLFAYGDLGCRSTAKSGCA